jgi:hypothetical protein
LSEEGCSAGVKLAAEAVSFQVCGVESMGALLDGDFAWVVFQRR